MNEQTPEGGKRSSSELSAEMEQRAGRESANLVKSQTDSEIAEALQGVRIAVAMDMLSHVETSRRSGIMAQLPAALARQWTINLGFEEETVGRLMESPKAVFGPEVTVGQATEQIKQLVKHAFITYGFVVDPSGRLVGVITFRDLLVSDDAVTLGDTMLQNPFTLAPDMPLKEAWKAVLNKHFPVYPVCDSSGKLVGLVRGSSLFEEQAVEISAQAGTMVGVDKEERMTTPWARSFKFRHPWLQLNLLTAFLAAAVVGLFQGTIDRLVILAMFLPVLAGQSGNTGCQALAVTLRGMTLGELKSGHERALVLKEALLGLLNGMFVGMSAGLGMYVVARGQHNPDALMLAMVVWVAMIGSCVISGLSGALIPMILRKAGADPATASSIFLTTATDVCSMGMLLGLATLLVH